MSILSQGVKLCPKCKNSQLLVPLALNKVSMVDNKTYICGTCRLKEGNSRTF